MDWRRSIFSTERKSRWYRHLFFWLIIAIYYYAQSISPNCTKGLPSTEVFSFAFYSVVCFLPTCIFSVYAVLSVIDPYLIKKRQYGWAAMAIIILLVLSTIVNLPLSRLFFKLSCNCDVSTIIFQRKLALAFINSQLALFLSFLALGIKSAKEWYLQQLENTAIARETMNRNRLLYKANIYPVFFLDALKNIQEMLHQKKPDAAENIISLSELLSYKLYEAAANGPYLDTEINALTNLVKLENLKQLQPLVLRTDQSVHALLQQPIPSSILPFVQKLLEICAGNHASGLALDILFKTPEHELWLTAEYSNGPGERITCKKLTAELQASVPNHCHLQPCLPSLDRNAVIVQLVIPITERILIPASSNQQYALA